MHLQRMESTYGRLVPKPQVEGFEEDELLDEVVPIQDQIENLRTKISLKEKYNRVLTENFEESRLGASSILHDLFVETRELRFRLMSALKSEQTSVQNALRAHRIFQLAMTERVSRVAIPWLDDKLFDTTKKLNVLLDELNEKRKKLEDAERQVMMIEKWPRPGTLPWEIAALDEAERLDNIIENIKIKKETASILHAKYYNIKFILREEQGKYLPTLRALENQLRHHRQEVQSLQQMLDDAVYFRADSSKNLLLTEKEASENRKQRRKQMAKMKKAVEKVLVENHAHGPSTNANNQTFDFSKSDDLVETNNMLEEMIQKKEVVCQYRDRARRLVEVMRVSDLTLIPERSNTVRALGERLKVDLEGKEEFRDLLLKQRNQLMLMMCHFRYTGQKKDSEYEKKVRNFQESLVLLRNDHREALKRLQQYGDISIELRLCILATLNRLEDRRRHITILGGDVKMHMKQTYSKIKKLVRAVDRFTQMFIGREPERNYEQFVKQPSVQPRLIRIGSPVATDESDEDDLPDLKVPNRQEIKNKSLRVIHQAILRRGLR